jgi:hypothetical protein
MITLQTFQHLGSTVRSRCRDDGGSVNRCRFYVLEFQSGKSYCNIIFPEGFDLGTGLSRKMDRTNIVNIVREIGVIPERDLTVDCLQCAARKGSLENIQRGPQAPRL